MQALINDVKRVGGGLLVQAPDAKNVLPADVRVVSKLQPTPQQMADLMFAWRVAKYVKSNAIVFCGNGMTLGVGAGQMSRIDSASHRFHQSPKRRFELARFCGSVRRILPVPRRFDVVVDAGATCVIHRVALCAIKKSLTQRMSVGGDVVYGCVTSVIK